MYPLRLVHELRPVLPWTIFSLPIYAEHGAAQTLHERRFAGHWDEDNDERIFAAVLDVFFRHPQTLWNLYAVGERKGQLTIWAAAFPITDQSAWAAASAGPAIQDSWPAKTINLYSEILRTGGRQMIETMTEGELLRRFPPDHDQLNWLINLFELGPPRPLCAS